MLVGGAGGALGVMPTPQLTFLERDSVQQHRLTRTAWALGDGGGDGGREEVQMWDEDKTRIMGWETPL